MLKWTWCLMRVPSKTHPSCPLQEVSNAAKEEPGFHVPQKSESTNSRHDSWEEPRPFSLVWPPEDAEMLFVVLERLRCMTSLKTDQNSVFVAANSVFQTEIKTKRLISVWAVWLSAKVQLLFFCKTLESSSDEASAVVVVHLTFGRI